MAVPIVEEARRFYDAGCPFEIPVPEGSLFELLETSARFYPERVAIDYFGREITYREFHDRALRAAGALVAAGVKKGDVVAVALPNTPQALIVFYGCMRIGATVAEHNPLAPAAEIADQMERHGARIAVVWEKCAESFPSAGTPLETVFTVDITRLMPASQRFLLKAPVGKARALRAQMRATPPPGALSFDEACERAGRVDPSHPGASGSDRAAILHTGGTNGVPKSVPLTHRNIGANVNQCLFWVWKLHEGAETFWSLLPFFHSFGLTFFCCAAVAKAASQVVLPKFDVDLALDAHKRRPITFFVGVPPMFERIEKRAGETGTSLRTIRFSVAGAMPLSTASARRWEEATGGMIVEGYGLTETSPVLMGAPLSDERRHGVLGLPFASTEVRLVDLEDPSRDVPEGEPGEILVKGPQVFEGYLDAPEESARVFTEDGWFRTGDVGVLDDGFIRMTDRKKELILSGGFNVYPSQVEEAIRGLPGVKDVAVVGIPSGDEKEDVVAALVLEEGSEPISLEQVRLWAERTISHYALPRIITVLADLPRNPLGKVMRRRVRELIISGTVLPLPRPQAPKDEGAPLDGGEGAVGSSAQGR